MAIVEADLDQTSVEADRTTLVVRLVLLTVGATAISALVFAGFGPVALWPSVSAAAVPVFILPAGGFLLGMLASVALPRAYAGWVPTPARIASGVLAAFTAAATGLGEISFTGAALLFILGCAAIESGSRMFALFAQGESFEVQSHWGGLGGGLGGWRVSPVFGLALVCTASILGAAAAARAFPHAPPVSPSKPTASSAAASALPSAK